MSDTPSAIELPVDHFNDIARELINRLMTELNAHPGVKLRTKDEWCVNPLLGVEVRPLVPMIAMFLRNRLQLIQPRQTDIFSDNPTTKIETFVSDEVTESIVAIAREREAEDRLTETIAKYASKEPEPEPEKPAGKVSDAIEILALMSEKTINLNQAAAHFGVDKEALRTVINTPGSGIVVGRGGYLNVATAG